MTINQLSVFSTVLLMVFMGLNYWVYHVSLRISSIPERIWGPAWLNTLLLGLFILITYWLGMHDSLFPSREKASLIPAGVICLFFSGLFYFFWKAGMDEDTD